MYGRPRGGGGGEKAMIETLALRALPLALAAAVGFAAGSAFRGRADAAEIGRLNEAISRMQAVQAEQARAAAEESARRLAQSQAAERDAVLALQETRRRLSAAEQRVKGDMYALPSASDCGLSAAARGMLNRAITSGGDAVPEGAGEPAGAAAAVAGDSGGSSESAVGGWIAGAVSAYDECRARIDAIRRWDEVTYGR